MGFSMEWEECYKANTQLSIWPWSDLVSYVMRYARPKNRECRVLEVGCGAGANIPFFQQLGVDYYAIEGSQTIVDGLRERFPEIKNNIIVGDFTKEIPFDVEFDIVVDRAAVTHNTTVAIENTLALVYGKLKKDGKYIGIDWFSSRHSDYKCGPNKEDDYTFSGYVEGQFTSVGAVHFSDKEHLRNLFAKYYLEIMEEKIIRKEIPGDNQVFASWNLVAKKGE